MSFDFGIIQEYWQLILSGIPIILLIAFICAILGTVIGLLCTLLRKTNGIGQKIVSAYIDIFRGTPVYVQLYVVYYGIPSLFSGLNINSFAACIIVFALNSGAYLSEIIRAGVESIDRGQIEAAKALGVKKKDIAFDIIIPQAFRNCLPAVVNEFITLTKETEDIELIVRTLVYKLTEKYPDISVVLINADADSEKLAIFEKLMENSCNYKIIKQEKI